MIPTQSQHRRWMTGILFCICLFAAGSTQAATPEEVDKAIAKAQAYIRSQQNKDGNWETDKKDTMHGDAPLWGGYTALATYAMLASGENPASPSLAKAVTFLKTEDIKLTYAVGLRCQVALYLPDNAETRKMIAKDAQTLLKGADAFGRYGYDAGNPDNPGKPGQHNSTSQYGVLGMWACERLGQEVPLSYWKKVEDGWEACQGSDGAWCYLSTKPMPTKSKFGTGATPPMTAAGLASMFITQEYLHHGADCKGNVENPRIDLAVKWLGDHFSGVSGGYAWYGIERIGVAGGYKYLGGHDWYREGAEKIVRSQEANGGWKGGISEACFNLVFLVRGRAPVMLNKLRYNVTEGGKVQQAHWNQRPRDCFNFVNWMDHQLETRLNWQIVDLANGSAADLNDAPVLFIAGNEALTFTAEEQARLRNFVEQGGLILGNADCNNPAFKESFKKLGNQLFPAYEFRALPDDHVIFRNEQFTKSKIKQNVQGLSNGVRELMLLPEEDLSRDFQGSNTVTHLEQYRLMDNLILYTLARTGLEEKGNTYLVKQNPAVKPTRTVKLARLEYSGNWNPEPYGWKRFAAILHNQNKIGLDVETVKLGSGALIGPAGKRPALPYPVAHLTGTAAFTLSEPQRQELREFLDGGGTLLIDAAGGSSAFSVSAEKELTTILGPSATNELATPLPLTHALFNEGGNKMESVGWRRYAHEKAATHPNTPRIFGLTRKGRIAVFYSREDISEGLVGSPVDGVIGYDPATSAALARNVVLYATGGK